MTLQCGHSVKGVFYGGESDCSMDCLYGENTVGAVRNEYFDGAGSEKYKIRILHEAFSYVHVHH